MSIALSFVIVEGIRGTGSVGSVADLRYGFITRTPGSPGVEQPGVDVPLGGPGAAAFGRRVAVAVAAYCMAFASRA